jgi:hypothetical protein
LRFSLQINLRVDVGRF